MKKITLRQLCLRIFIYCLFFVLFIITVRIKQKEIISKRQKEIISPMNEWEKTGIPVDVLKIKKTDFFGYTKLTISKVANENYEGYISAKEKETFAIGNKVYYEPDRNYLCGTISKIEPEINLDNGLYKIIVKLNNTIKKFNHREIVFVHTKTIKNIIQIPPELIDVKKLPNNEETYSFVRKLINNTVIEQKVTFKNLDREAVVIDEGLKEGDIILVEGSTQIRTGYPIFIRKEITQ